MGKVTADFGTCLQNRPLVGLQTVYVAIGRNGDMFGNHAEVVAYQVDDRSVFGGFFGIVQQYCFGMRQCGVNCPFHGEGLDFPFFHADEYFG